MTWETILEKARNAPWTPILLLALLVSNCMNWARLQAVERAVNLQISIERPDFQNDAIDDLNSINDRLNEISDNTESLAVCSQEIRPAWCRH